MWSILRHTCLTITPPPHHLVHLQAHMSQHYPSAAPCGPSPGTHVSTLPLRRTMWCILRHTCLNITPPPRHVVHLKAHMSQHIPSPHHVVHLQAHMSQHYPFAAPCGPSPGTYVSTLPLRRTMWSISRHTCLNITPSPHHVVHLQAHMSQHYPSAEPCGPSSGTHVSTLSLQRPHGRARGEPLGRAPRSAQPPEGVHSGGGAIESKIWSGYLFTFLFRRMLLCGPGDAQRTDHQSIQLIPRVRRPLFR